MSSMFTWYCVCVCVGELLGFYPIFNRSRGHFLNSRLFCAWLILLIHNCVSRGGGQWRQMIASFQHSCIIVPLFLQCQELKGGSMKRSKELMSLIVALHSSVYVRGKTAGGAGLVQKRGSHKLCYFLHARTLHYYFCVCASPFTWVKE